MCVDICMYCSIHRCLALIEQIWVWSSDKSMCSRETSDSLARWPRVQSWVGEGVAGGGNLMFLLQGCRLDSESLWQVGVKAALWLQALLVWWWWRQSRWRDDRKSLTAPRQTQRDDAEDVRFICVWGGLGWGWSVWRMWRHRKEEEEKEEEAGPQPVRRRDFATEAVIL